MRIGSVTKSFTGELLAHLVATGTVQLTAPLVSVVPEFKSERNPMAGRIRLLDWRHTPLDCPARCRMSQVRRATRLKLSRVRRMRTGRRRRPHISSPDGQHLSG